MSSGLGNVLVVGLGKSGLAAARFAIAHLGAPADDAFAVESLTVYGGKSSDAAVAFAAEAAEHGVEVILDCEDVKGSYDLAIISPGISVNSGFFQSAAASSREVVTEPELAFRFSPRRWIGITGTNGKTTTTTLTAHLLAEAGAGSIACGNIGLPCIEAACARTDDSYLVAELSSFQLESMPTFAPRAAILLNITPDHIEWHGSLDAYAAAKEKIFSNLGASGYAIVDCTAENTRALAGRLAARGDAVVAIGGPDGFGDAYHPLGDPAACGRGGCAYLDGGVLTVVLDGAAHRLAAAGELSIKGDHNMQNALAASAAALIAGVDDVQLAAGLRSYHPVEHRVEPCGDVGGVLFYNDSKATNTDAAIKALTAFPGQRVWMLLGGHDKGTDLSELVGACTDSCTGVICFGEAAGRFLAAFADAGAEAAGLQVIEAPHMREAFAAACDVAQDGDVVLLSPACSSFDEFSSYEERGKLFKQLVADLRGTVAEEVVHG
ncbi:MAG: UDP-N-acetylmuramoyl-L-alanine--D-glutamate ligase [Coriobacteriales bacterium]|jgi:UDP-N-acetylmuramoylalanine--D-glutamate ligase